MKDVIQRAKNRFPRRGLADIGGSKYRKSLRTVVFTRGQKHQNGFFVRFSDDLSGFYPGDPVHKNVQKDNGILIRLIVIQKGFSAGKMIDVHGKLIDGSIFLQNLLKMTAVGCRVIHNGYIHGDNTPSSTLFYYITFFHIIQYRVFVFAGNFSFLFIFPFRSRSVHTLPRGSSER